MARSSPHVVVLSESDRAVLAERSRSYTAPYAQVVRAKIVLLAGAGHPNTLIAERLDVCVDVVSKWRKRFATEGLDGLADRKRSGRPAVFAAEVVAQVKAMACEPPSRHDAALSRWSSSELARQAIAENVVDSVSPSSVRRWLAADAIRPWRYRSWIFPRDPDFAAKAGRVLDLYARVWDGVDLGPDDYVISADEKSQLQALSRCHPELPPAPGRDRRVEFEYDRHGTLGPRAPSLAGQASIARMREAWPTTTLVHLPVHASWLNQIEIVFSVVQRKVIKPQDFADLDTLAERLLTFQDRYNVTATPFDWRFTRADLADLLRRLDPHREADAPALAA